MTLIFQQTPFSKIYTTVDIMYLNRKKKKNRNNSNRQDQKLIDAYIREMNSKWSTHKYLNDEKNTLSCLFFSFTVVLFSQNITYHLKENIQYYPDSINHLDSYINERCVLDVYYPKDSANFATVVWFHGGGITGGNKEIPEALKDKGIAVIGVNYRLSPKISAPKYIEDAAASISWVFNNINSFGGDSTLIFISGHSAGGYLAAMVGLDKTWLLKHHIDANNIAGIIPFSGQMITHFTIRNETNISSSKPIIDNFAPLYHVRDDAPPLLLITGDRELELLGRYE